MVRIMSDCKILKLRKKAFKLQQMFIKRFEQQWGLRESVEELSIQIGHLIQSMINNQKFSISAIPYNQPNRCLQNIKDELCDCFLSICSICEFANINTDELYIHNTIKNDKLELVVELSLLSAQLLDSCLILQGTKPGFDRDEQKIFLTTYSLIIHNLELLAQLENTDIEAEFDAMIERTLDFLNRK